MRSERPMFSSSSTIRTRLEAICRNGQQHAEAGAAQFSSYQYDVAAREQRALARDGKPQPHTPLLKRNGGLKQRGARLLAQPRSGIMHFDGDAAVLGRRHAEDLAALAGRLRR